MRIRFALVPCGLLLLACSRAPSDVPYWLDDPAEPPDESTPVSDVVERCGERYQDYLARSEDFRPVRKDRHLALGSWDEWLIMPWRYRWPALTPDLARSLAESGFNGGEIQGPDERAARILDDAGVQFYVGHAAGKGDLHLRAEHHTSPLRKAPLRPVSLSAESTRHRLEERLERSIEAALPFSHRVAYALDDEISWTTFVTPAKWDNAPRSLLGFRRWLIDRYGSEDNLRAQWGPGYERFLRRMATPDDFGSLYDRPFREWNLSPWIDALSYMDSQFNNLVGELVEYANLLDPDRPTGFLGGQAPAPYGGYDYAKVIPKVQFLEVYDVGAAVEIARSFNSAGIPMVHTTMFGPGDAGGRWAMWFHLAHGERGAIPWAENWFATERDRSRRLAHGPALREIQAVSRKLIGGRFRNDGVALYYSHPSIQVAWFIDCERHGRTWIERRSSMHNRLSTSVATHWAWTKLLEDHHIQYDFLSYRDAVVHGIDPDDYPVVVLPAVLALSDAEVVTLKQFVADGGTLLADHQVGLFDHHGRGRPGGALDQLFGIGDHPAAGPDRLFGGRCLAEFDPERYAEATFLEAASDVRRTALRSENLVVAERELGTFLRNGYGAGRAMLLNVSVVEYLDARRRDTDEARRLIRPVIRAIHEGGVAPWVSLRIDGREPGATEVTYWENDGRLYCFVVKNPLPIQGVESPDRTAGISDEIQDLTIEFDGPRADVVDERTGATFGTTASITVPWTTSEAAVISFAAAAEPISTDPPARTPP